MTALEWRPGSGVMFDGIASRYDLLNRVLSGGIDRGWRRHAARALAVGDGARLLDLATGTADLALELAATHPTATIVGLDPSLGMLEVGRRKVAASTAATRIELQPSAAEALPFADGSFDGVTIAFGIRNVVDRARSLAEARRVLRPDGALVVLELGEPSGWLAPLARFHVHRLVPWLGALLSGRREYRYLSRSIAAFPSPPDFVAELARAGLVVDLERRFACGACMLWRARPAQGTR